MRAQIRFGQKGNALYIYYHLVNFQVIFSGLQYVNYCVLKCFILAYSIVSVMFSHAQLLYVWAKKILRTPLINHGSFRALLQFPENFNGLCLLGRKSEEYGAGKNFFSKALVALKMHSQKFNNIITRVMTSSTWKFQETKKLINIVRSQKKFQNRILNRSFKIHPAFSQISYFHNKSSTLTTC